MGNKAIFLGDPHCGKNLNNGKIGIGSMYNSRIIDQFNLLDWTLDQAIEQSASNIVITGDVFEDPKPAPYLITLFVAWLKKCQVYDVNVHIILGNHDFLRNGFIYSSPLDIINEAEIENVKIYKDVDTFFIDTTAFVMIPFRDRKSFNVQKNSDALQLLQNIIDYEVSCIPLTYHKVGIGHLAIEGSIPVGDEIDDIANELFCPLEMFKNFDYVWMGHVHKPQVLQKSPHIAHIGSMDISNFGETEHIKYIVIYDCNTNSFETQKIPTRNLKKIKIEIPKGISDTTEFVIEQLKEQTDLDKSIVRVELLMKDIELKSINKIAIENYLKEQGVFAISNISESKKVNLIKKEQNNTMTTKMDVIASIKKYAELNMDEEQRINFISLATDIYSQFKEEIE